MNSNRFFLVAAAALVGAGILTLEHIADEFDKQYESILAMRLRKIAAEIYQPVQAITAPPATPAS